MKNVIQDAWNKLCKGKFGGAENLPSGKQLTEFLNVLLYVLYMKECIEKKQSAFKKGKKATTDAVAGKCACMFFI